MLTLQALQVMDGSGLSIASPRKKAEVRRSFITTTVRDQSPWSHKGPTVGFELATNCIQVYAIANLDKTSLHVGV